MMSKNGLLGQGVETPEVEPNAEMPTSDAAGFSRRGFLKAGVVAGGAAIMGGTSVTGLAGQGPTRSGRGSGGLDITIAGYPVDHVKALADSRVQVKGCNVRFQPGKIGDLNTHVFSGPRDFEVTEIGLSPFMLAYANEGFRDYSLLPVFPIRLFRQKSVFVHADRGIERPEDLKGRKVGTPGYSSTSLTWIRGFMQHEYGVKPEDVEWVVSAADSSAKDAGEVSKQESMVPDGISIGVGPEGKDESQLLVDGDVDALFHAAEPKAFADGHPKIRRLFADARTTERDYFARTGIFPIMHAVAMKNDVIDAHPWLPEAVFNAYSEAKQVQYEAMRAQWIFGTLPWFGQELEETQALMGENFWPYGIEANRNTLEALFQYSYEQGLAKQRLTVEELFHPASLNLTDAS
jgi:4,5-dihydroxyphthalate decarboxylase